MTPLDLTKLKEEILRWVFSIFGAILVYAVIACLVNAFYHPDLEFYKNIGKQLLLEPGAVRPEPKEALLFRLAIIIIIPGIALFYILFSKLQIITPYTNNHYFLLISVLCLIFIIALIYFDFSALNPFGFGNGDSPQNGRDQIGSTNFVFYFDGLFLGSFFWLYIFIIVPLMACLFYFGLKKYNWENIKAYKIISSFIGYFLVGCCVITIILMNTYKFPYSGDNKIDFDAVYFSMTQVFAGAPMLVDHFTNTYGLYPQFLNPIFQLIGLNVFKFSLIMSLITGLSFLLNFYFLREVINNKIILFLGLATILFFPYFDFKLTNEFDSIFSIFAIRYIIPSALVCLATLYFKKPSQKKYWITVFISAMFVLWNPEMGLVCYISWMTINIYNDFYTFEGSVNIRKILFHVFAGITVLVATFYSYKLLIYAFYGVWPDLSLIFGTILIFSKVGFGLLPMSLVHPWNLMAFILVLGFTWSIIKWYKKEITPKSSMVLLVSLIGLGYFVYFQGRSHNSNFAVISGFCLMLLTILGDEVWKIVKNTNLFLLNALFIIFLFFISFSFVEIIFNSKKIIDLISQEEEKNAQIKDQEIIESNIDFVSKNSYKHEKILLFSPRKNQALYFNGTKRIAGFNPGFIDLFLKTDIARLENILVDSSFNIFFQPGTRMYRFLNRSFAIVAASYDYKASIPTMFLLNKRKTRIPENTFFSDTNQVVFHRKYYDDTARIKFRINDAFGINTFTLAPEFSIEILFYSVPQIFPKTQLIGNVKNKENKGFEIINVFNTSNYFFMINGNGFLLDIPYNQWAYCVMNVYPDHLEVYKNGEIFCNHPLEQPMQETEEKISISRIDYPYFGAISEVAINNKALDSNQIQATWSVMKQAIN